MLSEFSNDGSYYAQLTTDSKLKIWETSTNKFLQEFTPDFQLTSPCTCLHFVQDEVKIYKPAKKKKRPSQSAADVSPVHIALGTASGNLLFYSISKADLDFKINSQTNQSIGCLSWNGSVLVFSGIDQNVVVFSIEKQSVVSKWKSGNEKLTSILCVPNTRNVLTASRDIKLWNSVDHQLLKSFTGHSHEVILLRYISPPNENADSYLLSGSKGDRLLSVWNLNVALADKNAIANFLLEDIPRSASVYTQNGVSNLVAVTRSGVAQMYQHTLNGKCVKPLKPDLTIHIAAEMTETVSNVTKIPILCTNFVVNTSLSLLVGHGSEIHLSFESVDFKELKGHEKVQCWIRKDPWLMTKLKDQKVTNVHRPVVNDSVQYVTPYNSQLPVSAKRKMIPNDGPMEKRLENLSLNSDPTASKTLKVNNLAHLLVQGLHSKDELILKRVLTKQDENVIKNTLRRLPITVLKTLVEQIAQMIKGKTLACEKGVLWLKHFIQIHAGLLISNPELLKLLGPINGSIEHRISFHQSFLRLQGRLDLLIPQIKEKEEEDLVDTDEYLLVYTDKVENDEDELFNGDDENQLMDEDLDDMNEEGFDVNSFNYESSDENIMV